MAYSPQQAVRSKVRRRILLVDDEPAILLTMKAILERSGFEVVTAASSVEAKLRLEADSYQLIITDLRMKEETSDVVRFASEQQYRPAVAILPAYPGVRKLEERGG
jgi:CheY-like chemotaxis protein